jgi:hypothetical protein
MILAFSNRSARTFFAAGRVSPNGPFWNLFVVSCHVRLTGVLRPSERQQAAE